jgi:hypothetical protein
MNIPRQRRYPMRPIRTPTRPARPPVGGLDVITTDDGPQEWEYQRDGRWIHFRPTYITSTTSLNVARPE